MVAGYFVKYNGNKSQEEAQVDAETFVWTFIFVDSTNKLLLVFSALFVFIISGSFVKEIKKGIQPTEAFL